MRSDLMLSLSESLNENEIKKISNMKCGMFNNSSYWGYRSSVLKSGVCKYFRRELFDKFEWCVMEMMIFGLKNVGMMTNIINRMKILIFEEIVVNEIEIINRCVYLFDMIDNEERFWSKIEIMKVICDLVKSCRKSRTVSYVNNWWKFNGRNYLNIELEKVLKYRKNNDSNKLLMLGEWLILFIEEKNENVVNIFNKMLELSNEGTRYKKKGGIYLYFEILEDMCLKGKNKKLFDFVLDRFNKKSMKERFMFGVWFGLMCIKNEDMNLGVDSYSYNLNMNEDEIVEYLFRNRIKIIINEDFVVNDWHVNKKFGLGKFGKVGAFVENEDLSLLGENGLKYKEFYILKKEECDKKEQKVEEVLEEVLEEVKVLKEKKEKVVKEKKEKIEEKKDYEFIDFKDFEVVKVIVEGVCGMKICCIIVRRNNEMYVLKEMVKSFNYGRDCMFMDSIKKEFDILDLKMKLIKSNSGLKVIDKSIKSWKNNFEFGEKDVIYCMMKFYENIGDLGKNKNILEGSGNEEKLYSMLKIRLFDGLFRSSDNILRNILVLVDGNLLSIDENDIFGKRLCVFNKNDWCVKNDWCKKNFEKVIDDLWGENKEEKKVKIINYLIEYGFNEKVEEFGNRWENYKEIINSEFN
jgi:hypothetical protein